MRHAGIDLLAALNRAGEGDRAVLAPWRRKAGIAVAEDDTWSDIFSKVLVARIEPELGNGRPTVLFEYPRCEAALARASAHDARVAERFELYACGVELANGFGELIDPFEQRKRFEQRDGREGARLWRALSAGRGVSGGAGPDAAGERASRSASTGWRCWPRAPALSTT